MAPPVSPRGEKHLHANTNDPLATASGMVWYSESAATAENKPQRTCQSEAPLYQQTGLRSSCYVFRISIISPFMAYWSADLFITPSKAVK